MRDLRRLRDMLRELDEQLQVCMRCGMCQAVCPVYGQTGLETDVARGKLALLDGLAQSLISDASGGADRLSRCLLCGSCAASCPSGVQVVDIFIKARAVFAAYQGLSWPKRLILRFLLAHPKRFDRVLRLLAPLQFLALKKKHDVVDSSCARALVPFLHGRHTHALAAEPWHADHPELDIAAGSSGTRVALFVGCLIDKMYPQVAGDLVRLLEYLGMGVWQPGNQGCCGIPALASGDRKTFEALVRHNAALFARGEFDVLLTACASCTATIREHWASAMQDATESERRALAALAAKTMDATQFLARHLPVLDGGESGSATTVTWHDPCHLAKTLGVRREPRQVLASCPGYRFVEMEGADTCCGMGGSFNLAHYDLSRAMGEDKGRKVAASGCDVVATGCPACMLQMTDALGRAGHPVRVRHLVEVAADALLPKEAN